MWNLPTLMCQSVTLCLKANLLVSVTVDCCWYYFFGRHTHTHLMALYSGLPGWAGTKRVKPIGIRDFTEARDSECQWHQLGHVQVCNSLQTDNHASTPPLIFYQLDALPAAQPPASKRWRHIWITTLFSHVRVLCPYSGGIMIAYSVFISFVMYCDSHTDNLLACHYVFFRLSSFSVV